MLWMGPVDTKNILECLNPRDSKDFMHAIDADVEFLYSFSQVTSAYDASPDGKHFVATRRSGGAGNYLTVVQNCLAEFQNRR